MTFDDIRAVILQELEVKDGTKLRSSFERSLHRALHRMISRGGGLIATASSPEEGGKFMMRNGEQIVQCRISHAALGDLNCPGNLAAARDLPAVFQAHRELIEAIASEQFDQTSNEETRLVCIFSKHIPSSRFGRRHQVRIRPRRTVK